MKLFLNFIHNKIYNSDLLKAILSVGLLRFINFPIMLISSIILARGLGVDGLGLYSVILSLITVVSIPLNNGITQLITREVSKHNNSNDYGYIKGILIRSHQYVLILAIFIIIVFFINSVSDVSWNPYDKSTLILVASPLIMLSGLITIRSATLRGLKKFFQSQLLELLIRPGMNLIIISIFLFLGVLNPLNAIISQLMAVLVAFGLGSWFIFKYLPSGVKNSRSLFLDKKWGISVVPIILGAFVAVISNEIGILALGIFGSNEDVAALKIAMVATLFILIPQTIINNVLGPFIATAWKEKNINQLQIYMHQSARASFSISIVICLVFIFYGESILEILYGESYSKIANTPLLILTIGHLISVIFGSGGLFLLMCDYEKYTLFGHFLGLISLIIALVLFIPNYGAVGAAFSMSIGILVWNISHAINVVKRLNIRPSIF